MAGVEKMRESGGATVPDRTIRCADCNKDFQFTEREQEWYREKGLTHEPRR
ncbi:MAG TPA: zinc-ribbon domain containing protein, partial [Planctomycetota bacterium]|nr:zinc-ribbon domain containing protein [Planctomycetota bacterium]